MYKRQCVVLKILGVVSVVLKTYGWFDTEVFWYSLKLEMPLCGKMVIWCRLRKSMCFHCCQQSLSQCTEEMVTILWLHINLLPQSSTLLLTACLPIEKCDYTYSNSLPSSIPGWRNWNRHLNPSNTQANFF